jgi:hypothetical protein
MLVYKRGAGVGFKEAKRRVLHALASGSYQHEARREIDVKNKLATGEVTPLEVAAVIRRSGGRDHSMSPHHRLRTVTVHVIAREGWYIKFYFLEPDTWFISVHH